jgi:hypothetical protein
MNTKQMTEGELKIMLKERARAEIKDLADPKNTYTIWSENGVWSQDAVHIIFEGSTAHVWEKECKVRKCMVKTSYSRTMILDAVADRIEIVLPNGKVTIVASR